ncbi:MAG: DUF547 domain-containing protein [Erythrobacter sp.]
MTKTFLKAVSVSALLSASALASPALAQSAPAATNTAVASAQFARFTPSQTPKPHRIDYSIWEEALKNIVVSMGPSLRKTATSEVQGLGSRRRYGSNSRYRLEGTRVMFSFLQNDVKATFTEYRQDLQNTADLVDISAIPRNEQLAFWMNLHNVAMVEQIALAWPVRQPKSIEIGGVPLDESKFITVNGVAMSPKDIRTQIVYPNWKDPRVIYGFWRGEIGGPSIQRRAFNAENIGELLDGSGREFVNSLRGTQKSGNKLKVSTIYAEAAPFYFQNLNTDLPKHLKLFSSDAVQEILSATSSVEASIEERDIADLAGGVREPSYSNITSDGTAKSFRIPQSMAVLLGERERKFDIIVRSGIRTGTVTFTDIELPGEDEKNAEIE